MSRRAAMRPAVVSWLLAVVAVAGERVGVDGLEQPQLVVAAQHADAEPGQLGKGTDFQHGRFLTYM